MSEILTEAVHRPWLWKMPKDVAYIGKRGLRRKDGYEKASGMARYTRDVYRPGMLYAKFFLSPHSHAKIKSMDTSKVEALPGVWAVLRYDDPTIDWKYPPGVVHLLMMFAYPGEPLEVLRGDTAHWYGGPLGAVVVADSEEICDRALKLIAEGTVWEELPFILDPEEALKPDAPLLRPDLNPKANIARETKTDIGDVEAGFKEADKIIEWTMREYDENWGYPAEACCTVAEWKGDELEVWPTTQIPEQTHSDLAAYFKMPQNKVHVHLSRSGGTFDTYAGIAGVMNDVAVCAALAEAAHRTASPHIREMGTLGGNICQLNRCWYFRKEDNRFFCIRKGGPLCYASAGDNRYHSIFGGPAGCYAVNPSDTAPALVALDAKIKTSKRTIDAEKFWEYKVPGSTVLDDDEIVTEIQVPTPAAGVKSAFLKFAIRSSIDFPIVNCAAAITSEAGAVKAAKICLNAVYNLPYRATKAEDAIKGKTIDEASAEAAGAAAVTGAIALTMNKWKIQIAKALVKRTILACK